MNGADTIVSPNTFAAVGTGLNNASNAIDGNPATFASNQNSGFLNAETFALTSHGEQVTVIGVTLTWRGGGSGFGYADLRFGPASNPSAYTILHRTASFAPVTETFYLPGGSRVGAGQSPTLRIEVFGALNNTDFRVNEIKFILAARGEFASVDGAC